MEISGISETQMIHLCSETDRDKLYTVNITIAPDEPVFFVSTSVAPEWIWEFWYTSKTDYERVKQCIMDVVCTYDDILTILNVLSDNFTEYFTDMLKLEDDDGSSYLN